MNTHRLRIGIIGAGNISGIYLKNLTGLFADRVQLLGCADLSAERAAAAAEKHGLPKRYPNPEALIADPEIDLVVNLTIPAAHFSVCMAAVEAGKHVYVEKPLCAEIAEAARLLARAEAKGVRVGCAPDTFLGGGLQTCRKLIDDGAIGVPVAATAFMACRGHEGWHPAPEFYYQKGGGPMFDMGPYYLTALVSLVGPMARVSGSARISFPERTITSAPKRGTKIAVEVPTHVAGTIDFANGAIGTIITSFDIWGANLPRLEIHGSEGSLSAPDPNSFGGPVQLKKGGGEWKPVELTHGHAENARGLGVVEMAEAIQRGDAHRASGALAIHVLEAMHGIHLAAQTGLRYELQHTGVHPAALPPAF